MTTSRHDLDREIALEQAHVDKVYANLANATASAKQVARQGREIFLSDRTNWMREEDGTALFERDAFAYQAARRLAVLDAEHEGLVFGRLDMSEPADEVRHIGRLGVRDQEYEPLVIDWRAPAAEPFYRATQTDPMGVVRRRVLRCRDDKVVGLEDDLLDTDAETDLPILGEGALMASLTRARGRTMKDIVATIQAEQDEAIRAPYQGVTVIAGGPGTGKTVVALHRAAYLLYSNRARLEKGGVLVVGPSNVFMNYIERVLPSLGEDSVTLKAIGSVASDVLGMASERVDRASAATLKGSLRMLDVLRRLVRLPLISGPETLRVRVTVKGEVLMLHEDELNRIRDNVLSHTKLNRGRGQALDQVVAALARKLSDDVELGDDEVESLIREQASLQMFMNAWWPALSTPQVLARLADPRIVEQVAPRLTPEERADLVESYTWLQHDGEDSEITGWSVADMALLDELLDILGPAPVDPDDSDEPLFVGLDAVNELVTTADVLRSERVEDPDADPQRTFAHILVDEGQDITPMQWRLLRRRGPQSSWTIVGDPAQSSYPHQDETARSLDEIVGRGPRRTFTLSTNYRSPQEVFDLAAKVIVKVFPEADLPRAVRSTGVEPKLATTTPADLDADLLRHVRELAGQVSGTVGVVVPASRLTAVTKLTMSDPKLAALEARLVVVTALQAKGLEYDGVLVLSPDEIVAQAPGAERVLYVALTRATQRMTTLDVTEPGTPAAWRSLLS
ncbi:AAA family ATPase [Tessaracoccus rhinocerotis]|uniref:AAA family ATPase n=1 Tax=Tessaracoccus rhinocerotis TaxID=1689449 RepID=A0A553K2D0_9ACTN|nr:UvrD-helicase domain-containing protein [Tessaracoccus rhinocerotis]TRY18873.1 AAA family ATPase [Tessaracoccus rhinocerotis]